MIEGERENLTLSLDCAIAALSLCYHSTPFCPSRAIAALWPLCYRSTLAESVLSQHFCLRAIAAL